MFSMDFTDDPRYQTLVQKMAIMSPEKRAIVNSLRANLDSSFAGLQAKQDLSMLGTAVDLERMRNSLGLQKQQVALQKSRLATDLALRRGQAALDRPSIMQDVLGLTQVGLAGGLGYLNMQEGQKQAAIQAQMIADQRAANESIAASNRRLVKYMGLPFIGAGE
jgi:hypothetical protein